MKDKDKIIKEEIQKDLERLRNEISKIPNAHRLLEDIKEDANENRESLEKALESLIEISKPIGRLGENISYLLRLPEMLEEIRGGINEEIRGSSSRAETSVNASQSRILDEISKNHREIENRFTKVEGQVSNLKMEISNGNNLLWFVLALEGLLVGGIVIVLVGGG